MLGLNGSSFVRATELNLCDLALRHARLVDCNCF